MNSHVTGMCFKYIFIYIFIVQKSIWWLHIRLYIPVRNKVEGDSKKKTKGITHKSRNETKMESAADGISIDLFEQPQYE